MKNTVFYIIAVLILTTGCKEEVTDPLAAPKQALEEALLKLYEHDYNSYIHSIDIGTEMDTVHVELMQNVYAQYQERIEATKGKPVSVKAIDAKMSNDSVCTVFYQITYADSTKEVSSQKMLLIGGTWKIRIRN